MALNFALKEDFEPLNALVRKNKSALEDLDYNFKKLGPLV